MANTARLNVEILVDAARAASGLNDAAGKFASFASTATKVFAGAFAADKLLDGAKVAINAASDLEQAMGGVDAVFKGNADVIHGWAADSTDSIRITQAEWERLATVIGAQLKNAGVSMGELAPKTRDLMQLGADLAAQFGTSVPQAIEAVSSALKGERDPIERYGVTLKQAAIDAKALELAQGDQARAATQAVQAQATLALIFEQSADAQGAAARESETFAARMDSLKEKLGNMAAAIGGPLLDGVGSLADRFAEMAPVIEPIGVAITSLISAIAQLPTPVLAVVAGLAGLLLIGPKIVGALAGIGAAASGMMTTLGRAAAVMLTTPWGIALAAGLTVAAGAFAVFTAAANEAADQAEITATAASSLLTALKSGGDLRSAAYDPFIQKLRDMEIGFTTIGDVASAAGVDINTVMQALTGDGSAAATMIDNLKGKVVDLQAELAATATVGANGEIINDAGVQEQIDQYEALIDLLAASSPAAAQARKEFDDYNAALGDTGTAADEAADAQQDLKDAIEAAKAAAEGTIGNRMLEGVKRAAEDAARATDIFAASMADLTGRNADYESTTLAWADGIRQVAEAGRTAAEAGELNTDALKAWDIGALSATESGSALAASLIDQASQFNTFVTAAWSASGGAKNLDASLGAAHTAADQAYNDFVGIAGQLGLTGDEAQVLAGKLGIVNAQGIDDKVFAVIAEDENARATLAALQAQGVDPKTVTFVADADPLIEGAQAGFTYVDQATGETRTVVIGGDAQPATDAATGAAATIDNTKSSITVTGDVTPAQQAIQAVLGGKYTVLIGAQANTSAAQSAITALVNERRVKTIDVAANPAQALATINQVTAARYVATITVVSNVAEALRSIANVVNGNYRATIDVFANTQGAWSAINLVTGASHRATVTVYANADPFWSVFNSLPTSRTVTITTQNVTLPPAGGLAPAVAPAALAAPDSTNLRTLSATGPRSAAAPAAAGVVINVNGALDPDAVARQIRRILVGRDRRTGGVTVGAMRARVGGGV